MAEPTERNSSNSKWAVVLVVVAVVLAAGYYYASPYMTLYNAGQAFDEGDSEYICERIDFEQVRANLEEGGVAGQSMIVQGLIQSGIECETVESAMELVDMLDTGDDEGDDGGLFGDEAEAGFDGLTTFVVELGEGEEGNVRLVLSRTATKWQLTDIQFRGGGAR